MFTIIFILFTSWILAQAVDKNKGPKVALWNGWLIAMLMLPVWLVKGLGSITLDLRTGGAVAGLGGFLINDSEKLRYRFAVMDVLVGLLFLTHLVSGFMAHEMSAMTIPEIARRWLMPYIVGRVFISSTNDFKKFLPVVAVILLVLSVSNMLEAGTRINILCKALGKSFPILEAGEGYRWGIKRAQGPLEHPIFNGLMLVMAYPFAVEAGKQALARQGPRWWLALPLLTLVAVVCTASRGPIIAAVTGVFFAFAFSSRLRVPLLVSALVFGFLAVQAKDQIKEALTSMAENESFERYVEIDGKEYRYTGTAHRELLFLVYRKAIQECPFFGYGARLKNVPIEEHLVDRFSSIDNHYLLFYLQRGTAGLGLFIIITLFALAYLVRMAWDRSLPHSVMSGAMVGSLLGVSSLLTSVWFAPDHGAVWLFFVGLVTCMWTLPNETAPDRDSDPSQAVAHHIPDDFTASLPARVATATRVVQGMQLHPGCAPPRRGEPLPAGRGRKHD